jgi:hypothetical protein
MTQQALDALKEVLENPKAPPAARVSAAEALLSRGWGKPVTPIESGGPGEFDKLSTQELLEQARKDAELLGIALPAEFEAGGSQQGAGGTIVVE